MTHTRKKVHKNSIINNNNSEDSIELRMSKAKETIELDEFSIR